MKVKEYRNTDKDIHARIYRFVIGCFRDIVKKIHKSVENNPIIEQLASSLTSIGANDQEADAAGSRRDCIAKFTIVRKETKETHYWLRFIRDVSFVPNNIIDPFINEADEIGKIVCTIIKNLSK